MNILFFLTPKNDVAFIYSDANLREAIDLMEAHGYSALPILTKQGRYAGTLTEGDLLWYMKSHLNQSLKDMELISVMDYAPPGLRHFFSCSHPAKPDSPPHSST